MPCRVLAMQHLPAMMRQVSQPLYSTLRQNAVRYGTMSCRVLIMHQPQAMMRQLSKPLLFPHSLWYTKVKYNTIRSQVLIMQQKSVMMRQLSKSLFLPCAGAADTHQYDTETV